MKLTITFVSRLLAFLINFTEVEQRFSIVTEKCFLHWLAYLAIQDKVLDQSKTSSII